MQLFTVKFTTQNPIIKFDSKGKEVSRTPMDKPVVLSALPYKTAMKYQNCDNFTIERYVFDDRKRAKNGTDDWGEARKGYSTSGGAYKRPDRSAKPVDKTANAARTGNMAAAIN